MSAMSDLFGLVWLGVLDRFRRADLAARCGMSRMKLYQLLRGRLPVRWEDAQALARATGLPVDEVLQRLLRMREQYHKSRRKMGDENHHRRQKRKRKP